MLKNGETAPTDTAIDLDALRLDEGPPVVVSEEVDADAPPEVEAEAVEVAPSDPGAEALAGFSAEAAEILKTLPPEDLAHLMMLVKGAVAEQAEQAVMAAPLAGAPAVAEVEVEDNQAPGPKTTAPPMADATAPMAPQGLTADAVQKMIADALAMHGGAKKTDAAQTPATTAKAKPTAARVDEAEVAKQIKESRRLDAEFVGVARKDGHVREDSATVTQAATAMYGVIAECLPLLKEAAKTHIKNGRRDAFLEIYRQAEDIRRARLLEDQTSIFAQFHAAPGHIYTSAMGGRYEVESMYSPFTLQQFTLTFGGASPLAAGDYVVTFVTPASGTLEVTINSDGTKTFAAATVELDAAIEADPELSSLFTVTNDGAAVVTLVARSANLDMATPTTSVPGADTLTAAESVAPATPSLQMGLFYRYATTQQPLAISGTPRGAFPGALPNGSTTIALLRGAIGRIVNQTTLAADFNSLGTPDVYPAGQVWPGLNRGHICTRVDPASGAMTVGGQVHVVIAAGAYSVIGAVAATADGGNTIRIDNAPTGNILGRVVAAEENLAIFGTTTTGRYVPLMVTTTPS